ncbi:MAG: hypothetical protein KDM91_22105 [Verrucomicrobiae bacterium]|nr:hypothetical protein [Verrucomicrobiae bacterium]MCP5550510.1 hypothetical protein [Akkermansiaceae bacterium]
MAACGAVFGLETALPGEEGAPTVALVVGIDGVEGEYREKFEKSVAEWELAAKRGGAKVEKFGHAAGEKTAVRDALKAFIDAEKSRPKDQGGPLWLVLIGHGSFDGREAKFNVAGPDFTDRELGEWLKGFPRGLAVINTASASGSFLTALSGPDRVVVTATKSPNEVFYARFGEFFSRAIGGEARADLDNDEQVSLLEAFLYSAEQVDQYYRKEGRLATEHALIDDNGDGLGTRPDWFEGVRAVKVAKQDAKPDGERALQWALVPSALEAMLTAAQRERRDALELEIRDLTRKRESMGEPDYYAELEKRLVEIARIYEAAEKNPAKGGKGGGKSS